MIAEVDIVSFCDDVLIAAGVDVRGIGAEERDAFEASARRRLEEARRELGFAVPLPDLARFVGARVDVSVAPSVAIDALAVEDLYLACGCLLGIKGAVDEFVTRTSSVVAQVAARFARQGTLSPEDLVQIVITRLLVADGDQLARLSQYRGQGPLAGFVRVTAARLAVNALSGSSKAEHGDAQDYLFDALVSPGGTPEAQMDREHMRARVREAFIASVTQLTPRDRNLLHYSLRHGLSIDVIARMYGVHRATAARWIATARDELVRTTRDELRRSLSIADSEIDTLMRTGLSHFELSVARLLEPATEPSS